MADDLRFSSDPADLDVDTIHRWLSELSYWAEGRTRDVHERAMAGSRNYGVFDGATGAQLGYARFITDGVTFGWLADVFVDPAARGRGVGVRLVEGVMADIEPLGLKRTALFTGDAHGLYAKFGFRRLDDADSWMLRWGPGYGPDQA